MKRIVSICLSALLALSLIAGMTDLTVFAASSVESNSVTVQGHIVSSPQGKPVDGEPIDGEDPGDSEGPGDSGDTGDNQGAGGSKDTGDSGRRPAAPEAPGTKKTGSAPQTGDAAIELYFIGALLSLATLLLLWTKRGDRGDSRNAL